MKRIWACLGLLAWPVYGQYAGPAILSRGEAAFSGSQPNITFRPFLSSNATYSTGLSNVSVDEKGDLTSRSGYGANFNWGISGLHSWRRTKVSVTYRGGYAWIDRPGFSSPTHSLLLAVQRQLSRHVLLSSTTTAGWFKRDFFLVGQPQTSLYDPNTANLPSTDFFDQRTIYLTSTLGLGYQRTARLSFNFGGGVATTRRGSRALFSSNGLGAQGDVQYRLSRVSTVGAIYRFSYSNYRGVFGSAVAHSVAGAYSRALGPRVEFSGFAGVVRPEIQFLQVVQADPAITALLGITSGTRIVHSIYYGPTFGARISRRLETGSVWATATRGMSQGNGLFLTSESTAFSTGYGYNGLRRWSLSAAATYAMSQSKANVLGEYRTLSGGVTASRTLPLNLHLTFNYQARRYQSNDYTRYNRVLHAASVGIAWSPGELPLRVW